jgi:hypothetical protein
VKTSVAIFAVVACLGTAVALQIARDRLYAGHTRATERILYVRSPQAVKRLVLGFDALAADVYWIRAIQHYGGERLSSVRARNYELLYPLLELTTALDPYFRVAYRFGAIFLSEPAPGGPGRPEQAVALLQKGIAAQPDTWEYYHDIAFVNYWHVRDFQAAAEWFQRAADRPGAPNWLRPMAASMLSAGPDRASARLLWGQILQSDQEWLRKTAARSLMQIDALDRIDQLEPVVRRVSPAPGEAYSWDALIRRRLLRGIPLDPAGTPFAIDPATGAVSLDRASPLLPLPEAMRR